MYCFFCVQVISAIRLVVDTALHYRDKSNNKEWAVKELEKYVLNGRPFIDEQVVRLMSAPAQATSYMMGRLEFIKARKRVEEELGHYF